jgi:ferredoxin
MTSFSITIDGQPAEVQDGQTVLSVARRLGLDIPTLCYLEKCGPLNSCQVCLVKINGKLVPSCGTKATPGMVVESETEEVHEARRTALELLFSDHVGDCLSPCQRLCPLGLNIPVMLRHLDAGRLSEATATVRGALPLPAVLGRLCHHPCEQGCRRGHWDDPAAIRDLERFVADADMGLGISPVQTATSAVHPHPSPLPPGEGATGAASADAERAALPPAPDAALHPKLNSTPPLPAGEGRGEGECATLPLAFATARSSFLPSRKPATGKRVAIIGAGPSGLTAAYDLARKGHAVTVADRHEQAGGTLRTATTEQTLPRPALDGEISQLARLGIEFKLGVELGRNLSLEGLLRDFDAVLVTVGEIPKGDGDKLGVALAGASIKSDPNTCATNVPGVFAAGSAVRAQKQLVKAMAEGKAAAECVHLHLSGKPARRPEKPFSSIMGRLEPGELKVFLQQSNPAAKVTPCDACRGHTHKEAADEGSRCLHCDCHSSGNCVLQHYAQVYGADAGRFRSERRAFEQQLQPGGVIFEPGKCILCGICVKLTELAQEELGLTFVGRGFDVRVAAPFNRTIGDGLQKVAEECVKHCPTGALEFSDRPRRG